MAQARVAAGAVFSTVADTANAISGVVNTVSNGFDMANAFVRHQQEKQRFDHKVDMQIYRIKRTEEVSVEIADRKKKISDLLKDPEMSQYYNEAYASLSSFLDEGEA